jgi:hypothetical protein
MSSQSVTRPTVRAVGAHGRAFAHNFRATFDNNRAESLPLLFWLGWAAVTQFHRTQVEHPIQASALYLPIMAVAGFVFWVNASGKDRGSLLYLTGIIFFCATWSAVATAVGINIHLALMWLLILAAMYIPFLKMLLDIKHQQPTQLIMPPPEAPEPVDEFEGIAWLKGAKWKGPERALDNGVGMVRILTTPPGKSASDIAHGKTGDMAALLHAKELDVELATGRANNELVVKHYTADVQAKAKAWPLVKSETVSIREPIPFGVNRDGATASLFLSERHMLLGGISGAGKSCAVALVLCAAALDPNVDLYLIDPKAADMAMFRDRATRYCQNDPRAWLECLRTVRGEIGTRQQMLAQRNLRKVHTLPEAERPSSIVLIIDELASLTSELADRVLRDEIRSVLMEILRTGRSADVTVIAATQRPSAEAISGDLRSQFSLGFALKVRSQVETNMILGDASPVDASVIPGTRKGTGWLQMPEHERPILTRTFYLDDPDVLCISQRCGTAANPHTPELPDAIPHLPEGERLPTGEPLSEGWRRDLWRALSDEWQTTQQLVEIGGLTVSNVSVLKALDGWACEHLIRKAEGRPIKWRHN